MKVLSTEIHKLKRFETRHHNGRRFRNIWGAHPDSDAEKFDPASGDLRHKALDVAGWLLRKGLAGRERGVPAQVLNLRTEDFELLSTQTKITWLGHAACLVQADGLTVLTDPVFGERVSPVRFAGPRRLCGLAIEPQKLPRLDAIILSHNHYDHAESDTLKMLAQRDNPPVFVPLRVASLMKSFGFSRVFEMDWWQKVSLDGFSVCCLPAKHFSGRSATDRNETLWASFMISFDRCEKHVYFAGDTAYSPHFAEIAEEFPGIAATLMPIGAYLPRWFMREVHVSPDEAVQAFVDLKAKKMLGIHWGTYDLADEDWDQPRRDTLAALGRHALRAEDVIISAVGAAFDF